MPGAQDDYELVEDRSMGEKIIIIAILCTMCNKETYMKIIINLVKRGE